MKKSTPLYSLLAWCIITIPLLCIAIQPAFSSSEEIAARYLQPRGTKIRWKIRIPSPPPAAVIVTQTIPAGTDIKSSSPQYSSYDKETGTVKWLLDNVKPGTMIMKMELDRPIRKKGEISGKITFQDKTTRPIAEVFMTPKKTSRNKLKRIEGC